LTIVRLCAGRSKNCRQVLCNAEHDASLTVISSENTAGEKKAQLDLLHLVYSDGLASVSVFIEKNQGSEKHLQGASSMGAVNAFGNSVGDYFVTVVGEVPVKTVQSMAQSTVKLP